MSDANDIQAQLLPREPLTVATAYICGRTDPCRHVGGDYHDFLPLPGGEMGIAIGDVSGKGVAAALLMSSLQTSFLAAHSVHDELGRQ